MGRKVLTAVRQFAVYFCITLGVLILLLYLTALIPKEAFRENLLESAKYLEENEDEFYNIIEKDDRTMIHNVADAITFNIMYSIDGEDVWEELMISPFYSDSGNTDYPMIRLLRERIEEEKQSDTIYDRYWHGMMVLLRPLFCLFTIKQIRVVMFAVLMGSLGVLTLKLWKCKLRALAGLLWFAAAMTGYPMVSACMEYIPVWLVMTGVSLAAISCYGRPGAVAGLMVISGVCCAFFDFLTTETVAVVIPVAVVLCLYKKDGLLKSFRQGFLWIVWWCAFWVIAYLLTLAVKWGLSSLVLGQEQFSSAIAMLLRRQGAVTMEMPLPQSVVALVINVGLMLGMAGKAPIEYILYGMLAVTGILLCLGYLFRKNGKESSLGYLLFLLGIIPVMRILILNNHSLGHYFFVYRSLFGTIVCFGMGFVNVIDWVFIKKLFSRM